MPSLESQLSAASNVGLALGSGSARGCAHIGVIQALSEAGIRVNCVAGTSIGALIGAAFASGKLDALQDCVLNLDWKEVLRFLDVVFPKSGLIDGLRVADFIRNHVQVGNIEELPISFCAVATDLSSGQEVLLTHGDVIQAIRASVSVPGIFTPVMKDDTFLVDGGLVNPVPVGPARQLGADFVIAVDLNHDIVAEKRIGRSAATAVVNHERSQKANTYFPKLNKSIHSLESHVSAQIKRWTKRDSVPNIFDVLLTSLNIMENRIAAASLATTPPDLLIRPAVGHIRFLEFHRAEEAIAAGYHAARDCIQSL